MKRGWPVRGLLCLGVFLLGTGVVQGQSTGSIVGWGSQVVVEPSVLDGLVTVAASGEHSLGVKSDGTIVAWGDNGYGQCNIPAPYANAVAVAGGMFHSLGLKSDETIVAWGRNNCKHSLDPVGRC